MRTKLFNKLTAWLVTLTMMLTLIPTFNLPVFAENSQIEAGDFIIAPTDGTTALTDGTDYSFADGKLTVTTTTPVTVGMKDGVETTDDIIIVDSVNGETYITLDNVKIDTDNMGNTADNQPITVKGANKVTLDFIGTNSLSSNVEGTHSQVIGINAESKTPLVLTSTNSGSLSISDIDYGIYLKGYIAGGSITVNGSLILDIKNCLNHAIYASDNGIVSIGGTSQIDIDTGKYAIYAKEGIAISGGVISVKNDSGYAICSAEGTYITLNNDAELHITEAKRGLRVNKGKVVITDNAKYKVYNESTGEQTPAIVNLAISSGELEISQNAVVDVFTQEDGISGGVTTIKDNADVSVKIDCDSTYSQDAVSFDTTLDISDNAKLDIDVINGTKIRGVDDYNGTVNVSGDAVLDIDGTTYTGIYVKSLNLSDRASVTVKDDKYYAVYGAISVKDSATLTATSADKKVIYDPCTVTPAGGKAYIVKYGKSESEADTEYCSETKTINDKSAWRYFSVSPTDVLPVTITGENKTITFDGSKYDVSTMFTIDSNAGAATYSIIGGTGEGTLSGSELTITKAGTIDIKVVTDVNGSYLSGEATATLTVNKGIAQQITFPTASTITYGDTLEKSTFTGGNENGSFAWKDQSTIPTVENNGYTVSFAPNDEELYDYTGIELEKIVPVSVNPLPVNITWNLPESLVYDGNDKTISAEGGNKVGNDIVNLTVVGTTTAKNKGDYTATVTGIDNKNYTLENGENLTKNWSIGAKELTADNITAIADTTYTGEEIKPVLEIKDGDTVLTFDTDYTVEYQNNINATGETKAKAVVTFIGNYIGTVEKEFVILPKMINTDILLTAPVKNATPQTSIETDEYTATVVWSPEVESNFAYNTVYTATVTVTPKANYTTTGVAENGYTFNGAETVVNAADDGEITVTYPATGRRSSGGGGTTGYTVKFDTDGGNTIANKTVTKNSKLTEPLAPEKDGYTFVGWYTDKELTQAYDFEAKVTKAFTLYAKWAEKETEPTEPTEWVNPFDDIKTNDWFYDSVKYVTENGLFSGITDTTFEPNGIITRAMMVTVLYRNEGEPAVNKSIPFNDVDMGGYYANAVIWAKQNNIVSGHTETEFAPNDNITREQIAAIMHRYAQYKGYDVTVNEDTDLANYNDYANISDYAQDAMLYAVSVGLITGKTETTLNPQDNATRAEVAAILQRFIEVNK